MRTVRRNTTKMKYALYLGQAPIYETDEDGNIQYYTDEDGEQKMLETGEKELTYSTDCDFQANISMSGSEAEAKEYGLSLEQYQAKILYRRDAFPIKEGTLIWVDSQVEYRYAGQEIEVNTGNEVLKTKAPVPISADYRCIKISKSLNMTVAILQAINK